MTIVINIAEDFSKYPGGRFREDGKGNGTTFREDILVPAIKSGDKVEIRLDGASGYPSSFLEEVFGGLVRKEKLSPEVIKNKLTYKADEAGFDRYIELIKIYIDKAVSEQSSK